MQRGRRAFHNLFTGFAAAAAIVGAVEPSQAQDRPLKVIAVLGPLGDPFFSAMEKGTKDAAKATGVEFEYTAPNGFDNLAQDLARLIDIGAARRPDAMVIGNFVPDAENEGIRAAVAAGIKVVIVNTGSANWSELGAVSYVGEDAAATGRKAAELHLAKGAKSGLCVNHVPGNPGTEARCSGFKAGMEAGGGRAKVLSLPYSSQGNPQQIVQAIAGELMSDKSIDAVYTLGSGIAANALQAVEDADAGARVKVGTSDVSRQTLEALRDGKLAFDLDQQPYLQAYYGVQIAAQDLKYGMHPIGAVTTGPLTITKDNVGEALKPGVAPYRGAM